jgi:hypothetical protein
VWADERCEDSASCYPYYRSAMPQSVLNLHGALSHILTVSIVFWIFLEKTSPVPQCHADMKLSQQKYAEFCVIRCSLLLSDAVAKCPFLPLQYHFKNFFNATISSGDLSTFGPRWLARGGNWLQKVGREGICTVLVLAEDAENNRRITMFETVCWRG